MLKFLETLQDQFRIKMQYGMEYTADLEKVKVGLTPRTLVMKNGGHCLYLYQGKKETNQPLLMIYSLINRPYIFDLRPGRSMIEYLCNQGFDVYLIDWSDPDKSSAYLTLEELVNDTIHRFTKFILKKCSLSSINILGYCMGATFTVMYAGIHPELVNKIVLLTPPLGNDEGGLLQKIAAKINWKNKIGSSGIISGRMLKLFFNSVRPIGTIKKERDFWANYNQEKFMDNFLPVEKWSNDTPDLPGQVFFEILDICFKNDLLKTGEIKIGQSVIDFTKVKSDVLSVAAQHDWIVPCSSLETVKKVLPNANHQEHLLAGGHIGLVIGRSASTLWDKIIDFLE